jgi:hypothetical protein
VDVLTEDPVKAWMFLSSAIRLARVSPSLPFFWTAAFAACSNSRPVVKPQLAKPLILSLPTYFTKLAVIGLDLVSANGRNPNAMYSRSTESAAPTNDLSK